MLENGLMPIAKFIPSPNFDERSADTRIELVVIHSISLPPGIFGGNAIVDLFTNNLDPHEHPYFKEIFQLEVSSHFLIRRDGELIQFVPCDKRAWHAGKSTWQSREQCNEFSIGIELEGCDDMPFEEVQYAKLNQLIECLMESYPITGIAGHNEIAPERKTDPGPLFDWNKLNRSNLHPALSK